MIKSVPIFYKIIMSLAPESLLSSSSRDRCISHLKELPVFVKDGNTKSKASVLIPICVDNDEVCILYTLRSSSLNSHSGQVAFPGGKTDENETVYDTALRETEEEIGISPDDIDIWAKMSQVQGRDGSMIITPVVGQIKNFNMNKLNPNADEVADVFTVPIKVLSDSNNHGCYKYKNIAIPVFNGGKHTIWGITGMITHLFLQCFLPKDHYSVDFLKKEYKLEDLMPSKL